jgi:hypothetical protein
MCMDTDVFVGCMGVISLCSPSCCLFFLFLRHIIQHMTRAITINTRTPAPAMYCHTGVELSVVVVVVVPLPAAPPPPPLLLLLLPPLLVTQEEVKEPVDP